MMSRGIRKMIYNTLLGHRYAQLAVGLISDPYLSGVVPSISTTVSVIILQRL